MDNPNEDLPRNAAAQVADYLGAYGYAFVEDDQLDELTAALRSFLAVAGIAVNGTDSER